MARRGPLDLRAFFADQGRRWAEEAADKLRRGQGADGRFLKPKVIPNGRPLGYESTADGVPGRLRRAPVKGQPTGFDVTVGELLRDHVFHTGRRAAGWGGPQVPRPYAAISERQSQKFAEEALAAILREGRRLKVFR